MTPTEGDELAHLIEERLGLMGHTDPKAPIPADVRAAAITSAERLHAAGTRPAAPVPLSATQKALFGGPKC